MFQLSVRNFQDEFDKDKVITNHVSTDSSTGTFNEDGIFSENIFGKLGNGVDYSCSCGHYEGEFNLGHECEYCHTKVSFKGLNLKREGWIDLLVPHINPLFFRYIRKVIGRTDLERILNYKGKINLQGHLIEPEMKYPYEGIGMTNLEENFDRIIKEFAYKKKKVDDYEFLLKNRDYIFIDKFPIINVKLRPAIMINNDLNYHEMNNYYNGLIKNCNVLNNLTDIECNEVNIFSLLYKNQELLNSISDSLLSELNNKEGYIRSSLFGSRLNFTSRCVITPLGDNYAMDEIHIPYIVSMELFKPLIIRKIQKVKKINIFKANKIWFDGILKFDEFLYNIMMDIIQSENIKIILNRNPTLSLGSMLSLRPTGIKKDITDLTSSINNLILILLSGDYDGDVLNHIAVFGKEFCELFKPFSPSNMVIDMNNGKFNKAFVPSKDVALGMQTLIT